MYTDNGLVRSDIMRTLPAIYHNIILYSVVTFAAPRPNMPGEYEIQMINKFQKKKQRHRSYTIFLNLTISVVYVPAFKAYNILY